MRDRKPIRRNETVPVPLRVRDRDLITTHTILDLELEEILDQARITEKALTIDITLDDLDLLLGCVAAAANHAENPELEATMDEIYDRLSLIEGAYKLIEENDGS